MDKYLYRINGHTLIVAANPISAILRFLKEFDNLDVNSVVSVEKVFDDKLYVENGSGSNTGNSLE